MQQLLGNERLLKELNTAVKENRIAHAYLLCGGEGSGKKTLADIMCRMFLCSDGGCGRCAVCAKLEKNIHPDVVHITGATKSGNYSVDQIRSLRREALVYPNEAGKKIYILHQAEKLTPNAQDAFLKILEEPPEFVVFLLLCSDESKLLATIHSRVIRLAMETPDSEESLDWLIGKTGEEASLCTVALGISGGNPGRALKLLETGLLSHRIAQCEEFCKLLTNSSAYDLAAFSHKLAADKAEFCEFVKLLCLYLRDVLVSRSTRSTEQLVFAESIRENSKNLSVFNLRNIPEVIEQLQHLAILASQPYSMLLIETSLVTLTLEKLVR